MAEEERTVRNVVSSWVEAMVLEMEGGQDGSRGGALLWRCCGVTMRSWLPSSAELERNLARLRQREQAEPPFEVRPKLVAPDKWQCAVDELERMDGGGLLGPASAAIAAANAAAAGGGPAPPPRRGPPPPRGGGRREGNSRRARRNSKRSQEKP